MPLDVAVAIILRDHEVVIGRRTEGQVLAGYWEFPGGKVEPGEAPATAAVREALEETGLAIEVESLWNETTASYPHGDVRLRFYACRPVIASAEPRAPYRWIACHRLHELPFPAANREILRMLRSID